MNHTLYESVFLMPVCEPYQVHKQLWKMVGKHSERPFLYREDRLDEGLLVHLRVRPDVVGDLKIKEHILDLSKGQKYEFTLRAVPIERALKYDTQDGVRSRGVINVLKNEDAIPWLTERAERNGFIVDNIDHVSTRPYRINKPGHTITLNDGFFQGKLTVLDSERFAAALDNGIGRHKGLGFGLLQISKGDL